jgi:hypothetical protein
MTLYGDSLTHPWGSGMSERDRLQAGARMTEEALTEAQSLAERASLIADDLGRRAGDHGWRGLTKGMNSVAEAVQNSRSAITAAITATTDAGSVLATITDELSTKEIANKLATVKSQMRTAGSSAVDARREMETAKTSAQLADAHLLVNVINAANDHLDRIRNALGSAADEAESEVAAAQAWGTGRGHVALALGRESITDSPAQRALPHAEKAKIDTRKLTDYALNPDHPVGRNKARVFEATTGFNRENHASLLEQLHQGVRHQPAESGRADQYGQRYTVDIPVRGPTGDATVRTGWLLEAGSSEPRLLTLYVK